jgi:hypothetical protein
MAELSALKSKRGHIKGKLTRGETFVVGFGENDDIELLKTRKASLEVAFREFEEVQIRMAELNPNDESLDLEFENFENTYFKVIAAINNHLSKRLPVLEPRAGTSRLDSNTAESNHNRVLQSSNILPKIKLPTFGGAYSEFLAFYDSFDSLVGKDNNLNDCQKLNFLRSCLTGEALRAIEALSVSSANYNIALDILKRRFKNDRLIIQDHINSILTAPNIIKNSDASLRQLLDTVTLHLEALKVLNIPVESWDSIIVTVINTKLDYSTKKDWEATLDTSEMPKLSDLKDFLEKRCQFLASVNVINKNHTKASQQVGQSNNQKLSDNKTRVNVYHAQSVKGGNVTCHFCKGEHPIYQCSPLLDLSITERKKQVKNHKLCFNCLFNNHQVQNCKSKYSCRKCNERHHTILHQESEQTTNNEVLTAVDTVNNHAFLRNKFVLLSTAIVLVKNSSNQYVECRALLDAGSQSNFISEHMVTKLNLNLHKTNLTVGGINQTISTITQSTKVIMKSRVDQSICEQFKCFVVPKITEDLPNDVIDKSLIYIPPNIKLADPLFHKTRPVDLLIGAELFWNLLSDGRISQSGHQPHFQETKLGWVIAGFIKLKESLKTSCHLSALSQSILEKQVAKFWILEEISHKNNLSSDELQCEGHFQNNFARDENGRFIVRLPFKNNKYDLGSSLEQTKKRFYSVERKLNNSQRELRQPYSNFMKEYLELGHMELVPSGEIDKRNSCYLPHHAVIKDSSTTTKLRVVFDGSSKTSNGLSLNDNLLPGPNLQQDLFLTLARFRCFQYVISSDIEKMYRQINIDERDADFQRILWRESVDSPLEIYRLKTVTYGTTSAPFLAMRCIQQFANENINNFPLACATIRQCFYMDDLLCGHNTFQETLVLRDQIIEILKQGQFNLRKWASNDPFLLPTVNSETSDNTAINLDKDGNIKTLGLTWNSKEDTLKFVIANSPAPGKITKRSILSTIAKIFDPLGLKAPFLVNAKLLLQKLWQLQLQWDQSVPNPLAEEWHRFLNELCHLSNLNILRKVIPQVPVTLLEIHGFADASMSAYGAAIYLRSRNSQGEYSTQLLCAKSRVAPLKTVSLPRLELCAALLLARLIHKTASALNPKITKQYLWTDTSIVLAWLAASPNSWQVFVANRVSEIQDLTSVNDWYHISTKDNPADVITRGMYPETLIKSETWWHGPRFLSKDLSEWPVLIPAPIPEDTGMLEKRKTALTTCIQSELPVISKFSSFVKLQRVIGYCLRFINNCRNKNQRVNRSLTYLELIQAHNRLMFKNANLLRKFIFCRVNPIIRN